MAGLVTRSGRWALASRRLVGTEMGAVLDGIVVIDGEHIVDVLPRQRADRLVADLEIDDVGDLVVMPGLIDPHVHVNEPGRTDWEGFACASRAAAAGGITTIGDMPLNSSPVTVTASAHEAKRQAATGQLHVDCALHGGYVGGSLTELDGLVEAGVSAIKVFLVDSGLAEFPPVDVERLEPAMRRLAELGVTLMAHAELPSDGDSEVGMQSNPRSYGAHLASRPSAWEVAAIERLIELCRRSGCAVHIVHLATADALPMLASARAEGLPITVETCPHYLTFAAEELPNGDPRFKCAPPIRSARHREALWQALDDGVIDLVASDHSPAPPDLRHLQDGDLQRAWGGIASLQLGLSLLWTGARQRGHAAVAVHRWGAPAAARLLGLPSKGRLTAGAEADLVVWDPDAEWTVAGEALEHRHPQTPYDGMRLAGRVEQTYLRGRLIFQRQLGFAPASGMIRGPRRRG